MIISHQARGVTGKHSSKRDENATLVSGCKLPSEGNFVPYVMPQIDGRMLDCQTYWRADGHRHSRVVGNPVGARLSHRESDPIHTLSVILNLIQDPILLDTSRPPSFPSSRESNPIHTCSGFPPSRE